MEEKFYKFVTTMLSLKIRDTLASEELNLANTAPLRNFEELLSHIVSPQKAHSYEYYEHCSRQLLQVFNKPISAVPG